MSGSQNTLLETIRQVVRQEIQRSRDRDQEEEGLALTPP